MKEFELSKKTLSELREILAQADRKLSQGNERVIQGSFRERCMNVSNAIAPMKVRGVYDAFKNLDAGDKERFAEALDTFYTADLKKIVRYFCEDREKGLGDQYLEYLESEILKSPDMSGADRVELFFKRLIYSASDNVEKPGQPEIVEKRDLFMELYHFFDHTLELHPTDTDTGTFYIFMQILLSDPSSNIAPTNIRNEIRYARERLSK